MAAGFDGGMMRLKDLKPGDQFLGDADELNEKIEPYARLHEGVVRVFTAKELGGDWQLCHGHYSWDDDVTPVQGKGKA
jgi:hypothetical protein